MLQIVWRILYYFQRSSGVNNFKQIEVWDGTACTCIPYGYNNFRRTNAIA